MPLVDVPGQGEVEFPDTMSDDEIAEAITANLSAPEVAQSSFGKNLLNAAARMGTQILAAPPLAAMDLGVAARNVGSDIGARIPGAIPAVNRIRGAIGMAPVEAGEQHELPSSQFRREILDRYTAPPSDVGGKAAEFLGTVAGGGLFSGPQLASVPANFARAATPAQRALAQSQQAGYVVPPATASRSLAARIPETIGGKAATAQDAAVRNMAVTNELARKGLGLADDADITRAGLSALRSSADDAYNTIRSAGTITADDAYTKALDKVTSKYRGAAKDFPELAKTDIADVVATVSKQKFDSDSAIDAISILRERASAAFGSGDKALGSAYRKISGAMEDLIERNLASAGKAGTEMLKNFRSARQLIAKSYSVEKALNPATGNVSATKLAQQLTRGAPLTGELRTAAEFGKAFPKAAQEILDSGSIRNTDLIVAGGTSALAREPWYLLYPFARQAVRAAALSPGAQRMLVQGGPRASPRMLGPFAVGAEDQDLRGLLD